MVDHLPDLEIVSKSQCFPLYRYSKPSQDVLKLGEVGSVEQLELVKTDNTSPKALDYFRDKYPGLEIDSEILFYHVYGLLHSPDYRERFATNLLKQLPRIPAVKNADGFAAFNEIGRKLGDLHVGYENVKEYPLTMRFGDRIDPENVPDETYRVTKMKFGKLANKKTDKTTILYNSAITVADIPLAAYNYRVNGKSAIEWVMDRQGIRTDKASGIVNDANDYAVETLGDTSYPLKLLSKITNVSMKSLELIAQLPPLDIAK